MKDNFDFFISYSKEDIDEIVLPLIKKLTQFGLRLWYYKNEILLGEDIHISLDKSLDKTKNSIGAIVILNDHFIEKSWCMKELNFFIDNQIKIFPLVNLKKLSIEDYSTLKDLENEPIHIESENFKNIDIIVNRILKVYISNATNDIELNLENKTNIMILYNDYLNTKDCNDNLLDITKIHNISNCIYCEYLKQSQHPSKLLNKNSLLENTELHFNLLTLNKIIDLKFIGAMDKMAIDDDDVAICLVALYKIFELFKIAK